MKLTRKVVLAANDDIQGKIGFKPALDTNLKGDELYKELYKKVLDVEIDDDDREELEDSTCEVIDALAEMFPNMGNDDAPEEVEEIEEVEEKPAKEKKNKKEKKVKEGKEPVAEEKPAKKAKKAKGAIDPAELAEQIKTDKKINRDGLYEIVKNNSDLFGDAAETLLTITNPMVLKKQMRNVLEGGEIEMTQTKKPTGKREKKEKAPKVVEKTLTEKVNEIDDLDELKELVKENKDVFPGIKAKKFDKVKKLRKAMLEVIVEPEQKQSKKSKGEKRDLDSVREERQKRIDWITNFINKEGGKVGRKKLTAKALEAFPKPAKAIRDLISYAKNPKYNKFEKLMVEVDGVIGWEDAFGSAKKGKKDKKEVAPEPVAEKKSKKSKKAEPAPVVEEKPAKKDKKEKKDKKGKKNKK